MTTPAQQGAPNVRIFESEGGVTPMTRRIVEAARELARTPDDMGVRTAFVRATFNLDRTATAIIELAELGSDPTKEPAT